MKSLIIFISLICTAYSFAQAGSHLILNEVMFFPSAGNNEFIEIYNNSTTENVDLEGFKIKYYSSSPDIITDAGEGTVLNPQSYAVLFEADYDFVSGIYSSLIPAGALIIKITDNNFGSTGMANTADRPLWLLSEADDTLDVYTYSADNMQTFSDEKIQFNSDSSQINWSNSIPVNGTPGFRNSVTPLDFDLGISTLSISPEIPIEGDNIFIEAVIKNSGVDTAGNFIISIFNDTNLDSIPQGNEQIYSGDYFNLIPGDSVSAGTMITSAAAGFYNIIVRVYFSPDEDTSNNTAYKNFNVFFPGAGYNDVVINEIMYAPSADEPEWVEIYNRSPDNINLKGWIFSDNTSSKLITGSGIVLPAGSFIVLTNDSSILNYYQVPSEIIEFGLPTLNNSGDAVVIKDSLGIIIDSLSYLPDWGGNEGKSIERINTESPSIDWQNWLTTLSRYNGTPGHVNSVTSKDFDVSVNDIFPYPLYPSFGDDVLLKIKVKNPGLSAAVYSLNLYEDTDLDSLPDLFLKTISDLYILPGDSSVIESGYAINNLQKLHRYYAEAVFNPDMDTSNNYFIKNISPGYPSSTIVINEIMYTPSGGEPEWVELFNNSSDSIHLKNWTVNDIITTPSQAEINSDIVIPPRHHIVISRDSSISDYHRLIPSQIITLDLPVLNNDTEGFVLKDSRGQTMDSVYFRNDWGGANGYSLERIQATVASNLPSNWSSSEDIELSTPGRINSITPKDRDITITKISSEPEFPAGGDDVFISAMIKNKGGESASDIIIEFYSDSDSNNVVDRLLSSQTGISLEPDDSLYVISSDAVNGLTSGTLTAAKVISPGDEDTLNNFAERFIRPGFTSGIVLINEIMYDPADDEPEWFEIINNSSDSINLRNWSVSDLLSTPTRNFITGQDFYLQPDQLVVVAKDTSFFSQHPGISDVFITNFGTLGNNEDGIILYDFREAVIDSVHYESEWGGKNGRSLERISITAPSNTISNWASSLSPEGSTPCAVNSILNIPAGNKNSIAINEIMSDPDIDNCEFLEFYNNSTDSINIGGWRIEDDDGNFFILSETSFFLTPGHYFLLAADSIILKKYSPAEFRNVSFTGTSDLGLLNDGELILLKDVRGITIDSVFYSSDWHNRNINITKNKSLERINPLLDGNYSLNWSTSVNPEGATPGKQNSIFTDNNNRQTDISVSPNPFSPDNDGFEDFCIINFSLSQVTSQIRIKIFDNRGRLVRTLANNQAAASRGSIIFDGLGDDGQPLRMGIYIIFLESLNDNSGTVENLKTIVVVARKL